MSIESEIVALKVANNALTAAATTLVNETIATAQVSLTEKVVAATEAAAASELARDASFALGPKYTTEPLGRAATADSGTFLVQGFGDVAAYEYRRVDASSSTLIASYPSASLVVGLDGRTTTLEAASVIANGGVDALLDVIQTLGYPGALTASPNGSGGTYALVTPIAESGMGIRYRYRANLAGTIYVQIVSKSGDTFTVQEERAIVVAAAGEGYAEFRDLEYQSGQYVGIRVSATGVLSVVVGTDPDGGWYYTNAHVSVGNSFNDAAATVSTRLNHSIELLKQVVTGPRFVDVEGSVARIDATIPPLEKSTGLLTGPSQTIGFEGVLPASPNGSAGTYAFASVISASGRGVRYRYLANMAGTIRVLMLSKAGDVFTVEAEQVITVAGAGEYEVEFPGFEYTAGMHMGVRVSATGVLAASGGTDDQGGWYYTNAQVAVAGTFSDAAATTNTRICHSIELLEQVVTGDRFLLLESAVLGSDADVADKAFHVHLVIGESHAAGVPTTLSPVTIPEGLGYCYRRATENLGHLQDPTGNSATSAGPPGRGSMFPAFGAQILRQTANAVGTIIVNSGMGGTTISTHWGAGGSSWLQAVDDWAKTLAAIKAGGHIVSGCSISIILGSNDAAIGTTAATYKSLMLDLIARARSLVGAGTRTPIVMMETGSYNDGTFIPEVAAIQQVQAELVRDEANVFMGYSARYAVARGQMIDYVHMNQEFNDACGAAFAATACPHGAGLRPIGLTQ